MGGLLPGHGGIFDRLDSAMGVSYVSFFNNHNIMFHKEGFNLIILFFILVATDVIMLEVLFDDSSFLKINFTDLSLIIFVFILWFFRNPKRNIKKNPELILSPADGKVIAIKEVDELEYFNDKKIQISIFFITTRHTC